LNSFSKIALVGNPNSGKSTVFNGLTGLNQKISNYPGVTVDIKTGKAKLPEGKVLEIIDLPGTYSIYPKSRDEEIVYKILLDETRSDHPDAVLIVVDSSNLKRNLLLCSQIIDLGLPVVIALNMMDIVEKDGIRIDHEKLSKALGIPVVPTNARKGRGLEELKQILAGPLHPAKAHLLNLDLLIPEFSDAAAKAYPGISNYKVLHHLVFPERVPYLQDERSLPLRKMIRGPSFSLAAFQAKETMERYRKIQEIFERTVKVPENPGNQLTERIDRVLTHRIWGYFFLGMILFTIFQFIFLLADYPMHLVEQGTAALSGWLWNIIPEGWLSDLLINGVMAGISGVIIFIPQIAILFGLLSILEDSGYMARVSYLTDRLMRMVGLNGKSVIPLISGMACAIPAIMSTRSIDNPKDRLITILVTPFISCSARIPVYTLVIAMFIPNMMFLHIVNVQGVVLMSLYLFGMLMAFGVAAILNQTVKGDNEGFFAMELPLYRAPRWRNVLQAMYEKAKVFTLQAGKIILIISMVLWFLASYGPEDIGLGKKSQAKTEQAESMHGASQELLNSFAGKFGRMIEPVIRPMGFDWKMGIALLTSFAAREVFVGTMATIYGVESESSNHQSVREAMLNDRDPETGEPVYTLATGISLLLFFALAMQCMSTLAIVHRETRSWKWPLLQLVFMTGIAYLVSTGAFHLVRALM